VRGVLRESERWFCILIIGKTLPHPDLPARGEREQRRRAK
jgi:hypothetical protein